jgi:hypothetical protein
MEKPMLTDQEWDLAVDLLERRRNELAVEIRHTSTREMRERLRAQLDLVSGLLAKVQAARAPAGARAD